jgi:hypothetical protein
MRARSKAGPINALRYRNKHGRSRTGRKSCCRFTLLKDVIEQAETWSQQDQDWEWTRSGQLNKFRPLNEVTG